MKRQAIQITATETVDTAMILTALCDDGTIWRTSPVNYGWKDWERVPMIPGTMDERDNELRHNKT